VKPLANERGAALVLVLFGMTLAMLFIMFQFGQLIQANKQVASAGKTIDAQNIRDMALKRYQEEARYLLGSDIQFGVEVADEEEIETNVVDVEDTLLPITKDKMAFDIDEHHHYEITEQYYDETSQVLTFKIVATAYEKEAERNGEIKIIQLD